MAIEGPLRELGIHDVFQLLDLSRKTGVLRVQSDLRDGEGIVLFDSGKVVRATILNHTPPMELLLLQAGKITEDDLALAQTKRTNGRVHSDVLDLLVEVGAISPKELERQLRMQVEGVVFDLMSWREGFFSFEERAPADMPRDARVKVSTDSLLMEAARRIDEWSRIADKVSSLAVIPMFAPVADELHASKLDLLPHEWEVLTIIDGERDLRGIAASLGRSEFEVAKIAYGLVSTGVITLRTPERPGTPAHANGIDEMLERGREAMRLRSFDEALNAAKGALAVHPHSADAHALAARALQRLDRAVEAMEAWRRAVQADPLTPHIHLELGFAAARTGEFGLARGSLEHFLRLAPSAPEAPRARAGIETLTRLMHLMEAHADA
jgi:tetratricopeptide (TPR) repeat protein